MHLDRKDFSVYYFAKLGIVLLLFLILPFKIAMPVLLMIAFTYQHVVARCYGLHVMPSMDLNCFMSNDKAIVNILSCTTLNYCKPEYAKEAFGRLIDIHMKARSETVRVFGDMYYRELDKKVAYDHCFEELPDGMISTQEELAKYVQERIVEPFADNVPKWKVFVQRNYLGEKGLCIFKAHHSFCDGMSSMFVNLQIDETYDLSKMI